MNVEVGDYIYFGTYEQDNDWSDGSEDIEWLVLDVDGDRALVISRYLLDCKPYNEDRVDITWEDCTLRYWLNDYFFYNAFDEDEQDRILTAKVKADINPYYRSTDPGDDTRDRIFLLSVKEAEFYFDSDRERRCAATEYAIAQGAGSSGDYSTVDGEDTCWWWMRSTANYQNRAALVDKDGSADYRNYVNTRDDGVRPVMWIDLNY